MHWEQHRLYRKYKLMPFLQVSSWTTEIINHKTHEIVHVFLICKALKHHLNIFESKLVKKITIFHSLLCRIIVGTNHYYKINVIVP